MLPVGEPEPSVPFEVFIVSKITNYLPQTTFMFTAGPHLNQLDLADLSFNLPGPIDTLLGADVAPAILTGGRVAGHSLHPNAISTIFGWVLMEPAALPKPMIENTVMSMSIITDTALEKSLNKFWEIEEPP